jgi:UDP-glucose 4-epimerase
MNILVTGGAGFLGSYLVKTLCIKNKVTVIDDMSTGDIDNLKNLSIKILRKKCWSDSIKEIKENKFDIVYHLAANAYIPNSIKFPEYDFTNNLVQTVKLLEAARLMKKPPRIVLFSSAAVLGEKSGIMKEDDVVNPISPYGASKAGVEFYGKIFAKNYSLKILIIRLFPMYGMGQKKQIIFDLMEKHSSNSRFLEVIGSGSEKRDLTFVNDAAEGIIALSGKNIFNGRVINLCSGRGITTKKIAEEIIKVSEIRKKIIFTGSLRKGDVKSMIGSTKELSKYWNPVRTKFSEGIRKSWQWFSSQKNV